MVQVIGSFGGGGAQRVPYALASHLHRHGVRSFGLAISSLGTGLDFNSTGATFKALGVHGRGAGAITIGVGRIRGFLRAVHPDVVHIHGSGALPLVVAATRLLRRGPSLVFTWHDSGEVLEHGRARCALLGWCLRRCGAVTGSSASVCDRLRHHAGNLPISVFHGGVGAEALVPTPQSAAQSTVLPPAGPLRLAWVGRIDPNKNVQMLLRAVRAALDAGHSVTAAVAGAEGPRTRWCREDAERLRDQLNLREHVQFLGQLAATDVAALLGTSHVGVQTSHSEGLSIALLEQMARGLAVVATDVGDTRCAVTDEHNGLLIPPGDHHALANALGRLAADPSLRLRLGAAARATVSSHFTEEAMCLRALDLYRALA